MEVSFAKDKNKQNPLLRKCKDTFKKLKASKLPNTFYYFLILLVIGVGFYMVMLVQNDFSLAYGGDYSAQYIPMGYHVWDYYHDWIKTGHFTLFDQELYLGANSIGSNAYYGLFSPFNIIIVIFPRVIVPQMVAITSIIKLACAGLFFSIYMRKAFNIKENVSFICGIAYAFAGWGAFYLWYNNYQDILVFLPLILLGIEKVLQQQKPWVLAIGVFFLAICNYVLMVPYLICTFFYAMFRYFQTTPKRTVKSNFITLGLGFIGFAGGLLLSLFVFFPALMATMDSPKLDSMSYGGLLKQYLTNKDYKSFFALLFSWNKAADQHGYVIPARVFYPILEFFFPATTCRSLPTLELKGWDFDDMAVSLWCYIPFIMFLVPALIQSGKEKKWSHYIGFVLLVVSLFTPFMYYVTMGFSNGYARWTLFIVSSLIAYVGIYIDKIPNVAKRHIHVGFAFALLGIIASWILTVKLVGQSVYTISGNTLNKADREFVLRFVEDGTDFTTIAFIVELVYTTAVYITLFLTLDKKAFHIITTACVAIEVIAMGTFVTFGHGFDPGHNNGYDANYRCKRIIDKIQADDPSFYRFYTSIGDAYSENNSFVNGYSSVSFFHSLYNFEVNDFTMWTGLRNGDKSVAGNYRGKYQDLDNLLGVKYYIISKYKSKYNQIEENNPNGYNANVPFDFEEMKELETNEYKVYENRDLNAFGYSYDSVYTGSLSNGGRFDITCIKNNMILSTIAAVSKEDAEDMTDLTVNDALPDITSLQYLEDTIHYQKTFYHLDKTAKYVDFKDVPYIPYRYDPSDTYDETKVMDYYTFLTNPTNPDAPVVKAGTTLYVRAPFSGSCKYNFYFLDKDNKIFMMDAHDDDTTDNTSYMRGFYVRKDAYKIAVCPKYYQTRFDDWNFRIYSEDVNAYYARRDALNADPVTDVKYSADRFTFKTNYTAKKFVVSRVAFDKGWKIKATNNATKQVTNLKVYKGNGGFVSFIAPIGDYSYEMTYVTPYLSGTYVISACSFMVFFTSLVGYHIYSENKKRPHLDDLYREN